MKFLISFWGKRKGAIGAFSYFKNVEVEASSKEEAVLKLYEHFDHIHFPKTFLLSGG